MRQSSKPVVRDGVLHADGGEFREGIPLGSSQWQVWLTCNQRFVFESEAGHFTAQREIRRDSCYWYAYRRRNGRLFKVYLGRSDGLTVERLEQASVELAGTLPEARSVSADSDDFLSTLSNRAEVGAEVRDLNFSALSVLPLTKIEPPALPEKLIKRARLTNRIKSPVTFIYTPSGFGKSTLLNEWRQVCGIPVAWVSLDAEDDQPSRFWFILGMALRRINPLLGQVWLRQFRIASAADMSHVVATLANEIVQATTMSGTARRFGLVLDDFHHIHHPDIHTFLQTLLEHLPPALQVVISSRTRPPLVLGQLRARGMVTELETDDLRFTLEEGIDFLWRNSQSRHLSYSEMQTLVKHTEGWVVGLRLATLALAQNSDRHQLMTAFTGAHTYLREYFAESVLYRQPLAVQSFLFRTAILKHLSAPLCNAVTGQTDGAAMLDRLWQENLFLVRLEDPGWYRYHDLFAETLYSQLQIQFPAEIPRLHRRAAEWYCAQNAPTDAVYHLLAIQAWEEAAAMIERMALRELEQSGEDSRLLHWLHQLPESVVQQHKMLLFVYVRLAGSALPQSEVEGLLGRVEANILRKNADELTPDERDVLTDILLIRQIARTGHSLASQISTDKKNDAVWELLNGILLYQRFNCPDMRKAAALARQVYESAKAQHNLFVVLMAGGALSIYTLCQGYLRESERVARQVLQQAMEVRGTLPETSSIALAALSLVTYQRNQLDQAHQYLLRASEVDPNPMSSNVLIMIAIHLAKIEAAQGKASQAQATLLAARQLHARRSSGIWFDQDLIAYQALLCLNQGDIDGADQLMGDIQNADSQALSMLVRADIMLHQGRYAEAEVLLTRLLQKYPNGFHQEPIVGARILLANVLFAQRKVNEARHAMLEAIRLCAPEGFFRPFLDFGTQNVTLLTFVMQTETLTGEACAFVKEALTMAGQLNGGQQPLSQTELLALSKAASISTREHEVLRLLSAGLSNREIAEQISISVSTVKTHLDNIYRKLGANSRTQAVMEAQLLELV